MNQQANGNRTRVALFNQSLNDGARTGSGTPHTNDLAARMLLNPGPCAAFIRHWNERSSKMLPDGTVGARKATGDGTMVQFPVAAVNSALFENDLLIAQCGSLLHQPSREFEFTKDSNWN